MTEKNGAAGRDDFNPADCAAIRNVIGAYAHYLDANKIDDLLSLFLDDAIFEVHEPDREPRVINKEQLSVATKQRFAGFAKLKNQRRHLMAGVFFESLTEDAAHAFCEMLVCGTRSGTELVPACTGEYEGWFRKTQGVWKISHWIDKIDSRPEPVVIGEE